MKAFSIPLTSARASRSRGSGPSVLSSNPRSSMKTGEDVSASISRFLPTVVDLTRPADSSRSTSLWVPPKEVPARLLSSLSEIGRSAKTNSSPSNRSCSGDLNNGSRVPTFTNHEDTFTQSESQGRRRSASGLDLLAAGARPPHLVRPGRRLPHVTGLATNACGDARP